MQVDLFDTTLRSIKSNYLEQIKARFFRFVLLISILAIIPGCQTAGQKLETSALARIKPQQTRQEVMKILGQPRSSEVGTAGKRSDFYQVRFARGSKPPLAGFVIRTVTVLYDDKGLVETFTHHVGEMAYRRTHQGWEAGQPISEVEARGVQIETDSTESLTARFGRPTVVGLDAQGDKLQAWYYLAGRRSGFPKAYELIVKIDDANRVKDLRFREFSPKFY
jgi:outer membrane protein assembly factor BamE (lipoprotein component of BamABCDE complex)